ncbi:MAG: glycosyltransferase [Burkholderiaceae bacterium]|nr:glycosyltransferase [Burkholderiaceae bacterium]
MSIPIRVRQFPRLVADTLRKRRVLARPVSRRPTFHLCYFSCESYFRFLVCALHSLKAAARDVRYRVLVFNDSDMPMTESQIAALKSLIPGIEVRLWPKSMGWGAEQIECIWRAYALAAESAQDDDYIARVDADVFFFNDTIFQLVERSEADMVGDGHYVGFEYCQGGCYFVRASAVRQVGALIAQASLADRASQFSTMVEDVVATTLVRLAGLKVWMTWFMMFPDELKNAGGLTPRQRRKFSCAHFVMKNKAAMVEAYEREVLPPAELQDFRALSLVS